MQFPDLVPRRLCKIPITVRLESEDLTYLGEPAQMVELRLLCNFQDRVKTILTDDKKLVQVTGTAMFHGDIAPDIPTLSGGTVVIFGEERRIEQGMKAHNPDGTVNYCRLEVV